MEKPLSDASLTDLCVDGAALASSDAVLDRYVDAGEVSEAVPDDDDDAGATVSAATPPAMAQTNAAPEVIASVWNQAENKVTAFTILLMEEFLLHYQLPKTTEMLKDELKELKHGVPRSADLWCEMYHSCRAILNNNRSSSSSSNHANGSASTLEKLVAFCVSSNNPANRKGGLFALDLLGSPVSVCASPKKMTSLTKKSGMQLAATASVPAFSLMDAHMQMMRSPVIRPSRRANANSTTMSESSSSLSTSASAPTLALPSDSTPESPKEPESSDASSIVSSKAEKKRKHHGAGSSHLEGTRTNVPVHTGGANLDLSHRMVTPQSSSYVNPALRLAHETQLKRDLSSVRILERELRHIRLEKIVVESKKALVKKLGYSSRSNEELQLARDKKDPYLNDLVLEKYGFSKRAECALCQFAFLQVNLPHKVSFKCIMDVHAKWQYEPPGKEYASKYRAPFCYDAVHVCRMCAQIVFEHTGGASQTAERDGRTRKGKAAGNQHQVGGSGNAGTKSSLCTDGFVSDPYALPPLFAEDCYDPNPNAGRDDGLEDPRNGLLLESPAKAIYASQTTEASHFMSSKEWEVINPHRSSIREAIEGTLKSSSHGVAFTLATAHRDSLIKLKK